MTRLAWWGDVPLLAALRIRNFALIEQLSVEFGPGLTVLTGETGAGKSIIFGALQLILGGRASSELIRAGADEATVEALFQSSANGSGGEVLKRVRELGIEPDEDGSIVFRRVVSAGGKNRCFINSSPVTLVMLNSVGEFLVDVHGQHQHQRLLYPDNHLAILDDFGSLRSRRAEITEIISKYRALELHLIEISRSEADHRDRIDLLRFQISEIGSVNVQPGEDQLLEKESALLASAEERHHLARESHERLYELEGSVVDSLAEIAEEVKRLADLDVAVQEVSEELRSASAQVEDAAQRLRQYADEVEFDPGQQRVVEERLDAIRTIKKKYGGSIEEVLEFKNRAEAELEEISRQDGTLKDLTHEIGDYRHRVIDGVLELSDERREAAKCFAQAVEKELKGLGMKKGRFFIHLQSSEDPDGFLEHGGQRLRLYDDGIDRAEFQFEPNVGEGVRPLARIVSGGELSRIMLAIKTVIAGKDLVPSLIFDEVDVGIGGAIAEVVGKKLQAIARSHQVFCITHLPQIASLARAHFLISKGANEKRTRTTIRPLEPEERVDEIARMSGGSNITAATRQHARELLGLKT